MSYYGGSSSSSSSSSSSAGGSASASSSASSGSSSSSASSSVPGTANAPSSASNFSSSSSSAGISVGTIAIITALIAVGGVVLIVVAVLIIKCIEKNKIRKNRASRQRKDGDAATTPLNSNTSRDSTIEAFHADFRKGKPIRFTPDNLKDFTSNYAEKLGSGGFGAVYKGKLPDGLLIAVKVLHETTKKNAESQFTAEVKTIGRTHHVNLVLLYGFCFDTKLKALVYEYMDNGSLDRCLFDKNSKLEWEKLHEIAVGIAKAIRYLHEECQERIIHYDIKPSNVLLDKNFSPKVADFGLAKLCDREKTHITLTGGRGTPGYVAPELWTPGPVTHKCDVYSYAMLLFEILKSKNLEFTQTESQEWFPRWVWEKAERGDWESIVMHCGIGEDRVKAERMCKVALLCAQFQAEARPMMSNVVRMLEGDQEIIVAGNPFNMDSIDVGSRARSGSTTDSMSRGTNNGSQLQSFS